MENEELNKEVVTRTRKPRVAKPKLTPENVYKFPLVELQWVDAEVEGTWEEHEIDPKLPVCTTVGFLIKETDDLLIVASTYEGKQTNARIKVPRAWLKSFKTLHVMVK